MRKAVDGRVLRDSEEEKSVWEPSTTEVRRGEKPTAREDSIGSMASERGALWRLAPPATSLKRGPLPLPTPYCYLVLLCPPAGPLVAGW